jgi:hypothetical protein
MATTSSSHASLVAELESAGVSEPERVAAAFAREECTTLAAVAELTPAVFDKLVVSMDVRALSESRLRKLVEDARTPVGVAIGVVIAGLDDVESATPAPAPPATVVLRQARRHLRWRRAWRRARGHGGYEALAAAGCGRWWQRWQRATLRPRWARDGPSRAAVVPAAAAEMRAPDLRRDVSPWSAHPMRGRLVKLTDAARVMGLMDAHARHACRR